MLAKMNQKKAAMTMLIFDELYFRAKNLPRHKENYYITIKWLIQQAYITYVTYVCTKNRV
jgi:hypothetical protein